MKDISQKPDHETMWKVECELNQSLQSQLKQKDEEILRLRYRSLTEACGEMKMLYESEIFRVTEQLKEKDEELKRARNIIKDLLVDLTDNAHEQAEIYLEKTRK